LTQAAARAILGLDIKGHVVKRVMVAAGADIKQEYYFSVLLDRANRTYLALCSYEGGMEIEQLAEERPEALARVAVDPAVGITLEVAREIAVAAKFPAELVEKVAPVFVKLYEVYVSEDATLVEVNPLVLTGAGDIVEIQATGEKRGFTRAEFEALYGLAEKGIGELFALQRAAVTV